MFTIGITRLFHIQCWSPPKGLNVGGVWVALLFSFLVSTGDVGAETLTVKGTGNDTFCGYDMTGKQMGCRSTNSEIELSPGTYSVSLHGAKQTATVQAGQKTTLVAGLATLKGTGNDAYCVYDSTGQQMGCLSTNQEIELFPGTYSVSLHGAKQTATVQAEQKTTLIAGLATLKGTGNDAYCVYDSTGQQMGCLSTNQEIELFPGTYNFSLHGAKQTATVEAEQKTVLTAGILKIPGNGEDTSCVYDSTGQQMGCLSTGREMELFAGTYTVKLNDTSQTIVVEADAPSIPVATQPPIDPSDATSTPVVTHPPLGPSQATDTTGKPVTTTTVMEGGNSVNGKSPEKQVKQKLSDTVDVKGNITVDPADVGQFVDIFVYAAATFPGSDTVMYFMLGPGLTISAWDQNPASLVAFTNATLGSVQTVPMYSGTFFYPGTLKVFFGYRLDNGTLVRNTQPIDITIDDDSAAAVSASNNEFASTFKRVEYYKPAGYCAADMILVWFLFEATGVNTSDLLYVEEKSIYQTDPANPYVESLQAFNSEGFIVRGFCAPPGMKSDFQVRLKEKSTGRLSNVMVFTVDVNSAVIDKEAPPLTATPVETEPASSDPILVSQVTNPDTELGFIATTGKETMELFGTKDSQGRLVSINKISFGSQTDESQNLVITLDKDSLPTTMEFPDGSKVEYSNYTSEGATATYRRPDGSVANQAFVPMPFDDIQEGAKAIEQFVQSPQQTEGNSVPSSPGSTSSPNDSNCKEVMGAFCNAVDNLFWGVFQLASVMSCAAAGTATILTSGAAFPLAAWACGSVMLSGIARMTDVMTGKAGCGKEGSPLTKLSNLNDVAQGVSGGLAGFIQLVADKILVDALKEALDPEKVCQAEPENKCDAMEKLCDKYKGTLWPGGVPGSCLCSVGLSLSQEEGKKFVEECKAIAGEPLGIVQCSY